MKARTGARREHNVVIFRAQLFGRQRNDTRLVEARKLAAVMR